MKPVEGKLKQAMWFPPALLADGTWRSRANIDEAAEQQGLEVGAGFTVEVGQLPADFDASWSRDNI